MNIVKEKYSRKELRSIYKDAKYNWSNNITTPLDIASNNKNHIIYVSKIDGEIRLYLDMNGETKYTDVKIGSFAEFIKFYDALIILLRQKEK
jgi:hypothetical protein